MRVCESGHTCACVGDLKFLSFMAAFMYYTVKDSCKKVQDFSKICSVEYNIYNLKLDLSIYQINSLIIIMTVVLN